MPKRKEFGSLSSKNNFINVEKYWINSIERGDVLYLLVSNNQGQNKCAQFDLILVNEHKLEGPFVFRFSNTKASSNNFFGLKPDFE